MKKIIENFNKFVESVELPDFRFEAILVNRSRKERGKEDILSDIRSLPGVTVVAVREAEKPGAGKDHSLLSLKVDRLILGSHSVDMIITKLTAKIASLEGVTSFQPKGIPEQL